MLQHLRDAENARIHDRMERIGSIPSNQARGRTAFYRPPRPLALWPRQSGMMLTARPPQRVHTKRRRSASDGKRARSSTPAAAKVTTAERRQEACAHVNRKALAPIDFRRAIVGSDMGHLRVWRALALLAHPGLAAARRTRSNHANARPVASPAAMRTYVRFFRFAPKHDVRWKLAVAQP